MKCVELDDAQGDTWSQSDCSTVTSSEECLFLSAKGCILNVLKEAADRIFMRAARAYFATGGQFVPEDIINPVIL